MIHNRLNKIHLTIAVVALTLVWSVTASAVTLFTETVGTPSGTTAINSYTGWSNPGLTFSGTGDVRNTTQSTGYAGASAGGNVFLTNTAGINFQIAGIDTTGYTSLTLSFGVFKSTTASSGADLIVAVSSDGVTYTPLTFTALPTGSGTAVWALRTATGTIPSTANLRIRFTQNGTATQYRIDDVTLTGTVAAPATYTWAGPTLGVDDFNVATNWSPSRVTPATNDILVINTGFAPTLSNVPTQTIGALRVTNNTAATLITNAANTLTVSGGASALQVDAVSSLTLAGANPLKVSVASGSSGTIAGLLLLQDSGHRLLGNAAGAVTFQNGALCTTASSFTGNPFGSGSAGDGVAGSVIFASGSKYTHNGGLSPFGTAGNAAVALFQTGSEANWLTAAGFQASGRTYADLTIGNATTSVGVNDGGSGNFQFDNLNLRSDSTLTFNGTGTSAVTIQGDITSEGTGNVTDVTLNSGTGGIILNRAGTQTFSGGGGKTIAFNGAATVGSGTTLALGRVLIQVDPTVLTVNGALTRTTGYVIGNLQEPFSVTGTKTFEVGTANGYSPVVVNVTALGVTPSSLRVKAVQGTQPQLPAGTSLKRYWTLTEIGDLTATLTFNYLDPTDIMGNEGNYQLTKIENGMVTRFPSATVNTAGNTATITGVQSFSDWTLAEPLAPTAAHVTVSGRVLDAYGRGIGRATVTLLDVNTNQTRTVQTGGNGSYVFEDVPAGSFYVISVNARRYTFAGQGIMLLDAMSNVNFVGVRE